MKKKNLENVDNTATSIQDVMAKKADIAHKKRFYKIIFTILTVWLITMTILVFICFPATIYGESMQPTLHEGQIVMISKVTKKPNVGDIVVYKKPTEKNKKVIKRVVAVAGDTLYFTATSISYSAHMLVTLNGFQKHAVLSREQFAFLSSKYPNKVSSGEYAGYYYFTIADGEVFTVGDNYSNSIDSRDYGPIKVKDIIGIKI